MTVRASSKICYLLFIIIVVVVVFAVVVAALFSRQIPAEPIGPSYCSHEWRLK